MSDYWNSYKDREYRNTLGRDLAAIESQLRELNRLLTRLVTMAEAKSVPVPCDYSPLKGCGYRLTPEQNESTQT